MFTVLTVWEAGLWPTYQYYCTPRNLGSILGKPDTGRKARYPPPDVQAMWPSVLIALGLLATSRSDLSYHEQNHSEVSKAPHVFLNTVLTCESAGTLGRAKESRTTEIIRRMQPL